MRKDNITSRKCQSICDLQFDVINYSICSTITGHLTSYKFYNNQL